MILDKIRTYGRPVDFDELYDDLNYDNKTQLKNELEELVNDFSLLKLEKGKYALPQQMGIAIGKISVNKKGFGFLLQEGDDVHISERDLNFAMNGDIVSVRVYGGGNRRDNFKKNSFKGKTHFKGHSKEGKVLNILSRNIKEIVGTVDYQNKAFFLVPLDSKLPSPILINELREAQIGEVVNCSIYKYPDKDQDLKVNVENIIGDSDDNNIDILSSISMYHLPNEFREKTLKEAQKISQTVSDISDRTDLRNILTMTVDGDDSKDFDDAISLSCNDGIYNLIVHIADVSHYVQKGSALDIEARERGNSVYFPGYVIPMLPVELSNGICSLNPNVDRYALSCEMNIDSKGKVLNYKIYKSVINSDFRMTYKKVNSLLAGEKDEKYNSIVDTIHEMENLRQILFYDRVQKGSLEFDLPETGFTFDDEGKLIDVHKKERGLSERIIEEFMLMANKTVCTHMINNNLPCAFRVHEKPTDEKAEALRSFLSSLGYNLTKDNLTPKSIQKVLNSAKDDEAIEAITTLTLRTLSKAKYSATNLHHFGLAFENYCHFTSPIRRYADLIVHRVLSDSIKGNNPAIKDLGGICNHVSETEKSAMEAEFHVNDLYKCKFLKDFEGEEFEGKISGMNGFGFYVELPNTCEGMVRLADVRGDYYEFNDKRFHIIGQRTKRIFSYGDKVKVKIARVNIPAGQVDFTLVEE